jgi:acyl carrier protein
MWDETFETTVRGHLPFLAPDEPLAADAPLRDLGLDSMGMVELMAKLEAAYDVRFLDDALTPENFQNPGVLWATVESILPVAR